MVGMIPVETQYVNFEVSKGPFGAAVIVLGAVCLFTGLLGCTAAKVRGYVFGTLFVLLALAMGLAFLIVGIIMSGFINKEMLTDLQDMACASSESIRTEYTFAVDKKMCSTQCPCAKGEGQSNLKLWQSYDDSTLREFNRTF